MLKVRWLLLGALATLALVSLFQPADASPANNADKPSGQKISLFRKNRTPPTGGIVESSHVTSRGKPKPKGDSRRKTRSNSQKRRRHWSNRRKRKGKKHEINQTTNSLFQGMFETIKNETMDLVGNLTEEAKKALKEKSKEVAKDLLNSLTTEFLAKTLCDCQRYDCECCVNWGVLGSGCLKIEANTKKNPGIDIMVRNKCNRELASITLNSTSKFGADEGACFNMIPYVTDACIVPSSFNQTDENMDASFVVTVDAFTLSGNYRIKLRNRKLELSGSEFKLF